MPNSISPILQTLQQSLNAAQSSQPNGHLSLDVNTMGSAARTIVQLFEQSLFQDNLVLKGTISISPQQENDSLVVSGTATEALYDVEEMEAVCTFGVVDNSTLTFNVKITPPDTSSWSFSKSFYELENTFFDNLTYTAPTFILSTHEYYDAELGINVKAGGNFYIQPTSLDGPLAPALSLIDSTVGQPMLPFYGPLIENGNGRQLYLRMPFPDIELGVTGLPPLAMVNPRLVLSNVLSLNPESEFRAISAQSDVQIGGVTLPLAIQLPSHTSHWEVGLIPGRSIALSDVPKFLGSITGIGLLSSLPNEITAMQAFYIDMFSVSFDIETKQFWSLYLGVSSKNDSGFSSEAALWTIIPDLLELRDISFLLGVNRVLQGDGQLRTEVEGTISGTFEIASALDVEARISLPIGSSLWTLSTSTNLELSLSQLTQYVGGQDLKSLLPGDVGTIGDFTLLKSIIAINPNVPTLSQFGFTLVSTNDWTIIPERLVIKNIIIDIKINNPLTDSQVTGYVEGTIGIGRADIEVSVSRYEALGNWLMNVKANLIPLPSLQDIASLADADLTAYLPDSLATASYIVSNLDVALDLSTKTITGISFILLAEFDWKYYLDESNQDKYFAFSEVNIAIEKTQAELTLVMVANFEIAGVTIQIVGSRLVKGWQFSGSTGQSQEIPIGALLDNLATKFDGMIFPEAITDLTLQNIGVSFNTTTKNFTFTCETKFPIGSQEIDMVLTIDIKNEAGVYTKTFGGRLTIGTLHFDLIFEKESTAGQQGSGDTNQVTESSFLAIYSHTGTKENVKIKELMADISSDVAEVIPQSLEIDLKDVLFAYYKTVTATTTESKFLVGLDLGVDINLSGLPLVGGELSKDETVGVSNLRILVASQGFKQTDIDSLNVLLPQNIANLTVPLPPLTTTGTPPQTGGSTPATSVSSIVLTKGVTVTAQMNFGSFSRPLAVPVADASASAATPPGAPNTPATVPATPGNPVAVTSSDSAQWFTLQKAFGPVYFNRVGVQYRDASLWFLLDAALTAAGLTLSLDGLSIGSPIVKFVPKFDLRGLGLDYQNGPVEIGGAFLRAAATAPDGTKYDEYNGTAILKTEALTLSAIGSYAQLNGDPSLFVYAFLDYPLGGPAFFFVTGLAAGFGYNRSLKMPTLDQVPLFPLVQEAVSPSPTPELPNPVPGTESSPAQADKARLAGILSRLSNYVPPETGEAFLAVGIKFTSFKMIESFALLAVSFGNRFELDLLGLSTMVLPTPEAGQSITPLAEVQMALKASFVPEEGFLGVSAQLTNASYILSRRCQLTGGFAFYSWFAGEHDGDFVLSLGGYHPNFKPPAHYPAVKRLGFNWQVDTQLTLKGSAYFALTPAALMAGGSLQAAWQSDNLRASFIAGADFLVAWKPYHYEARIYVNIGVLYTFKLLGTHTLSADVGANLQIWGPDFGGTATIDISVISFSIDFGDNGSRKPKPISWQTFQDSFLPTGETVCGVFVKGGLVTKNSQNNSDLGVVNPKEFSLVSNSVIPSKKATLSNGHELSLGGANARFGIASMAIKADALTSDQTIKIVLDPEGSATDVSDKFDYAPILKSVPAGLWGSSLTPNLKRKPLITDTLAGFEIRPKGQPAPGKTSDIDYSSLQYETEDIADAYDWQNPAATFAEDAEQNELDRRVRIKNTIMTTANTRNALLIALGLDQQNVSFNNPNRLADDFVIAPQVGSFGLERS